MNKHCNCVESKEIAYHWSTRASDSHLGQRIVGTGMLDSFRSRSGLLMLIACKISPNEMNQSYPGTQIIETTSTFDLIKK